MRTLVIGLGNPILRDDSVGLRVAQALREKVNGDSDLVIEEDYWGGLRLMEQMIGFDRAFIVDAIQTGAPPGTIHVLTPDQIPTQRSASAHDVNLPTALAFGRTAGAHLPSSEDITLIGIEADDVSTFDTELSPEVEAAIPEVLERILAELHRGEERS